MHHSVSGINSLIHYVSLASHVSIHLLIHLSDHLYYHHHSRHPSLVHSRLKTYFFNKSFFYIGLSDCLHDITKVRNGRAAHRVLME